MSILHDYLFSAVVILVVVTVHLFREFTWYRARRIVHKRNIDGDFLCGTEKTWYGWKVVEYAESEL